MESSLRAEFGELTQEDILPGLEEGLQAFQKWFQAFRITQVTSIACGLWNGYTILYPLLVKLSGITFSCYHKNAGCRCKHTMSNNPANMTILDQPYHISFGGCSCNSAIPLHSCFLKLGLTSIRKADYRMAGWEIGVSWCALNQAAEAWEALGAWILDAKPEFGPGIKERFEAAAKLDPQQVFVFLDPVNDIQPNILHKSLCRNAYGKSIFCSSRSAAKNSVWNAEVIQYYWLSGFTLPVVCTLKWDIAAL